VASQVERTHRGSCEVVGGARYGGKIGVGGFSSSLSISEEWLEGVFSRKEEDGITTKSGS
jgi:hypothetical protein